MMNDTAGDDNHMLVGDNIRQRKRQNDIQRQRITEAQPFLQRYSLASKCGFSFAFKAAPSNCTPMLRVHGPIHVLKVSVLQMALK
jgi:hypothetical protein